MRRHGYFETHGRRPDPRPPAPPPRRPLVPIVLTVLLVAAGGAALAGGGPSLRGPSLDVVTPAHHPKDDPPEIEEPAEPDPETPKPPAEPKPQEPKPDNSKPDKPKPDKPKPTEQPAKPKPTDKPKVAFTAHQAHGTSDDVPPYDVFWGTATPGTAIGAWSQYGTAKTTADAAGTWEVKVAFASAPAGTTFPVKVKSSAGDVRMFEFTWVHEPPDDEHAEDPEEEPHHEPTPTPSDEHPDEEPH